MVNMTDILLCSDLDRTLIPNGPEPESPQARTLLRQVCSQTTLRLAYVSGRHLQLILDAIADYQLPTPDFIVADVGTTIYSMGPNGWGIWQKWHSEIGIDWYGIEHTELLRLLSGISDLELQEPAKQGRFKLSYYVKVIEKKASLLNEVKLILNGLGAKSNLIWSIDDLTGVGLLDILPARANKLHAITFLAQQLDIDTRHLMFAGDSGNDLEALGAGFPAVLVHNAVDEVRQQAIELAHINHTEACLYLAQGNFLGMNGNYSAGVLEGLAHYFAHSLSWMELQR